MKIHIGCGKRDFGKEWIHVDAADFPHVSSKDVFLKDVEPESVYEIYSAHFIEYFDREEVKELLMSWHKALAPIGKIRIAVPDFSAIVKMYRDKEYELDTFLGLLYGKMEGGSGNIYHKTTYDYKSLCRVLSSAGFQGISLPFPIAGQWRDTFYIQDDHSQAVLPHRSFGGTPVSLNVIAYK